MPASAGIFFGYIAMMPEMRVSAFSEVGWRGILKQNSFLCEDASMKIFIRKNQPAKRFKAFHAS